MHHDAAFASVSTVDQRFRAGYEIGERAHRRALPGTFTSVRTQEKIMAGREIFDEYLRCGCAWDHLLHERTYATRRPPRQSGRATNLIARPSFFAGPSPVGLGLIDQSAKYKPNEGPTNGLDPCDRDRCSYGCVYYSRQISCASGEPLRSSRMDRQRGMCLSDVESARVHLIQIFSNMDVWMRRGGRWSTKLEALNRGPINQLWDRKPKPRELSLLQIDDEGIIQLPD